MRIILILVVTIIFYWAMRQVFISNCFRNLSAEVKFDHSSIFQGETVNLTISVSNKKLIPLWWLVVKYKLSRRLVFINNNDNGLGNDNYCAETFFVMSYERVTKEYKLLALKRGYYFIGELELNSGDFFGDTRLIKKLSNNTELYVYPEPIDTGEVNILYNKIYGEIIAKRSFLEDPFQLKGIREYSPFDSMKIVNWKATARSGELKVNQFNSTCSGGITILLNVEKFNNFDKAEILEKAVSLAAALATKFIKVGLEVELISNGRNQVLGEAVRVEGGSNFEKNIEIYEALAALNIDIMERSLLDLIDEEIIHWRKNKVIILISHYNNINAMEAFRTKLLQGYTLKWIVPEGDKVECTFDRLEEFVVRM